MLAMECSDENSICRAPFSFKDLVMGVEEKGWVGVLGKVGRKRNRNSEISKFSSPPRPRLKLTGVFAAQIWRARAPYGLILPVQLICSTRSTYFERCTSMMSERRIEREKQRERERE